MKFEELQQEWQAVKTEPRSHSDLRRIMYTSRTAHMMKFQWKEIRKWSLSVVAGLALFFLLGYFEEWSNIVCTVLGLIAILNHHLGLQYIRWLPQQDTLQKTLLSHLSSMKIMLLLSRLVLVAVCLLAAFIIGARMNLESWSTAVLGLATLLLIYLVSWWTSRKWSQKIADLKAVLEELDEDPEVAVGT